MKCFLFIDNFRGFINTYIPIADVNFLVGENSTGKTSVLGLVRMISSPDFLYSSEFSDSLVRFGHFSDMVSVHAEDQSYFRIGFAWEEEEADEASTKKRALVTTGWLATYASHEGMPYIRKFTFCKGGPRISLLLPNHKDSSVYFKLDESSPPNDVKAIRESVFPEWINDHSGGVAKSHYQKLRAPFHGRAPLLYVLSLVFHQHLEGQTKKKNGASFLHYASPMSSPSELTWVAPIRTKPRRTYDELALDFSPEGTHTPYLIRRLLRSRTAATTKFRNLLNSIGESSGLFQSIKTKNFGKGATAPFELDVILDGKPLNLCTVGYGVSQSLPVLVEILARPPNTWFAIQQPEVHLHPRAQASLGDVLFQTAVADQKRFLVETHSDFTIDRFRMNLREPRDIELSSQILFFERKEKHNTVTPLEIGERGELPAEQPDTYRDFFLREEMRVLEID